MRSVAVITAAAIIALAPVSVALAGVSGLMVPLDQSRRVPFSGHAASIINGNSDLIHAYIVSPSDVRVVGRKLGVTNLVVLDSLGNTLFDREINISAGEGSVVTVYRGGDATTYACSPNCSVAAGAPARQPTTAANPIAGAAAVGQALTAPTQP
jgi:hypothetical protein